MASLISDDRPVTNAKRQIVYSESTWIILEIESAIMLIAESLCRFVIIGVAFDGW